MMAKISPVMLLATLFALHVSAAIEGLGYVTRFGSKHYWEHTLPRTQERAKDFCRSIGFDLVQIDSVEERNHLRNELGSNDYWTSGVSISTTGKFHWDLAWNVKNPVEIDVDGITSYSGIYFSRTNTLRTTENTVSMRPLCQHIVYPEGCEC